MHGFLGRRFLLLLVVFVWGVLMEIGQRYVPGRSFEYADMLANGVGIILGVGVFAAVGMVLPKAISQGNP